MPHLSVTGNRLSSTRWITSAANFLYSVAPGDFGANVKIVSLYADFLRAARSADLGLEQHFAKHRANLPCVSAKYWCAVEQRDHHTSTFKPD